MTWTSCVALLVLCLILLWPAQAVHRTGVLVRLGRLALPGTPPAGAPRPTVRRVRSLRWPPGAAVSTAAATTAGLLAGLALGWPVAVQSVIVVATVATLLRGRRAARDRRDRLADTRTAVGLLIGELEAGSVASAALAAAATGGGAVREPLERAAAVCDLGQASHVLAGCKDAALRRLAVVWRAGESTGVPLAGVLTQFGSDLRSLADHRRVVSVALAGPRSSAMLLALLPAIGIGLGVAMGAHPLAVLYGSIAGQLLGCLGLGLDAAGLLWMRRILTRAEQSDGPPPADSSDSREDSVSAAFPGTSRGPVVPVLAAALAAVVCVVVCGMSRGLLVAALVGPATGLGVRAAARRPSREPADRSLALALDLAAAALRAGRPVADAIVVAAPAAGARVAAELRRVAGLLRLGAEPATAWHGARDGPLQPVVAVAIRSAASGARLALAFERTADEIRDDTAAAAGERAQRAGIAAMGPLAACFLPSFVCLGIVPVVVGIARTALGVLAM